MQNGEKVMKGGKPMIEFVAVQRQDNQQWAVPGVGDTNTFLFKICLVTQSYAS